MPLSKIGKFVVFYLSKGFVLARARFLFAFCGGNTIGFSVDGFLSETGFFELEAPEIGFREVEALLAVFGRTVLGPDFF